MNADLSARLKTAAILIATILFVGVGSLYWCFFKWILFDIACAAVVISAYEYVRFSNREKNVFAISFDVVTLCLPTLFVAFGVTALGLCENLNGIRPPVVELSLLGFFLAFIISGLLSLRSSSMAIAEIAAVFSERSLVIVFLGLFASFLPMLAAEFGSFFLITWFITVIAINDSAAYFAGRKWGRHEFALVVSPRKTIEGSLAGLICGVLIGALLAPLLLPLGSFIWGAILAFFIVIAAQVGDLVKSMLKRLYRTKDSGSILPGHGGVLDRIDGLIGAAPIFYLFRDWFVG